MSAPQPQPWMRHWIKRGQPVRWVVRGPDGRLYGFADEAELCRFIDDAGLGEAVLDLHRNRNHESKTHA